ARWRIFRAHHGNASAVLETGEARGDDPFGCGDAFGDDGGSLGLQAHRDGPQNHALVVLNHVGEGAVGAPLHGRSGNDHDLAQGLREDAHVDELARPKLQVGVGELRLHAYGAGGLVDLVVDDLQRAAIQHGLAVGVECLDRHGATCQRRVDLGQLLLRQRVDDGDGPDLRDHDDAGVEVDAAYEIAFVDHADAG